MSRTVTLPCGIAASLLNGAAIESTGSVVPVAFLTASAWT